MPPDASLVFGQAPRRFAASPWRDALVALVAVWAGSILLFRETWAAMFGQWWSSSTYTHILLVPPILVWLVQVRAGQLAKLTPRVWWPGLLAVAAALALWLVGALADLSIAAEAGAVALLGSTALALLGPKVSAGLAFPLAYLIVLVPIGDELVPAMQMVTAKLTVGLVRISAIPATIDGVFINTPAGLFEVAEACSGVKFLIAMVAFGALVANVCFRKWSRRAAFMFLAVALPILANGVRAWATVFAAQWVGAERATGFDHIVYGWIFFAIVIAAIMAMSWRFFDRAADDPMIDAEAIAANPLLTRLERLSLSRPAALGAIVALAALAFAWNAAADRLSAPVPARFAAPVVPGWTEVPYRPRAPWEPRAGGADRRLLASYRGPDGATVDLFMAAYSAQGDGRDAGGFGQGALRPNSGWAWLASGPVFPDAKVDRLLGPGGVERLAATTYRTGTLLTGSNLELKLATIEDRLRLRSRPTLILILSAERRPGQDAAKSLRSFRTSVGPLGPWMDRLAGIK